MSDYKSNISLAEAARVLREAKSVMVTTHAKPDGDAIGSVIALGRTLHMAGVDVSMCLMPPVSPALNTLAGAEDVQWVNDDWQMPSVDHVVIVDTGAWTQLAPIRSALEAVLDRTLVIDHHVNGDVSAAMRYIEPEAAACCEIIDALLPMLVDEPIDPLQQSAVREALFVGVASDTGWFRFSNTRPRTHKLAAKLLAHGVDHAALFARTEQTEQPSKLALMQRALASLRLLSDGRIAVMALRASDFADVGATIDQTERLIDLPQMVSSVQIVALLTETPDGQANADGTVSPGSNGDDRPAADHPREVRISLRSKPGAGAVNVAHVATVFGGGGHARAAGGRIRGDWDEVIARVEKALLDADRQSAASVNA